MKKCLILFSLLGFLSLSSCSNQSNSPIADEDDEENENKDNNKDEPKEETLLESISRISNDLSKFSMNTNKISFGYEQTDGYGIEINSKVVGETNLYKDYFLKTDLDVSIEDSKASQTTEYGITSVNGFNYIYQINYYGENDESNKKNLIRSTESSLLEVFNIDFIHEYNLNVLEAIKQNEDIQKSVITNFKDVKIEDNSTISLSIKYTKKEGSEEVYRFERIDQVTIKDMKVVKVDREMVESYYSDTNYRYQSGSYNYYYGELNEYIGERLDPKNF